MKTYRTGAHWGVTVIETDDAEPADDSGRRPSDRLIGVTQTAADASHIVQALNRMERDRQ